MSFDRTTRLGRNPRFRFRVWDDRTIVTDPVTRTTHTLNSSAGTIWQLLSTERTLPELAQLVAAEFGTTAQEVEDGVRRCIETMWRVGMVLADGRLAPSEVLQDSTRKALPPSRTVPEVGRTSRPRPVKCSVELTWRCNLACRHCYAESPSVGLGADEGSRPSDMAELTSEEWRRVLRELADEGCMFLTLTGGEPLSSPLFPLVTKIADELGFVVRVLTNGTLVTREIVGLLSQAGCHDVEISIHGARAATHDSFTRVAGSFDAALRGVKMLTSGSVKTYLKFPITRLNVAEVPQMVELARSLGCEYVLNPTMYPTTHGSRDPLALRLSDDEMSWLMRNRYYAPHRAPCNTLSGKCRISPQGGLYPCEFVPWELGNLREQSFHEIWFGHRVTELRASGAFKDHGPACDGCPDIDICPRCPAIALLEDGDIYGPSSEACRQVRLYRQILN